MDFDTPMSFAEAVKHLLSKQLMPTALDSAGLRLLDASLRRQSFFSAQTLSEDLLGRYKTFVGSIIEPKQVQREGEPQTVTEGFNPATARTAIKDLLRSAGYQPEEGEAGTIKDLSSDARVNLVIATNVQLAQSAGHLVQGNLDTDVVDLWPAWEFIRAEQRKEPRRWDGPNGLWINACRRAGDARAIECYGRTERMCALKSSKVWADEIGDPDYTPGGLDDGLLDPVAFGTGMEREEMSREECEDPEIGLLEPGEKAEPAQIDLASLFGTPKPA